MVLENGYVTGSLFGPGWKHVQEWPHAGPSRLQGEPEQTGQPLDDDEYEDVEEEVRIVSLRRNPTLIFFRSTSHWTSDPTRTP